jgi:hypothetical protein
MMSVIQFDEFVLSISKHGEVVVTDPFEKSEAVLDRKSVV